MSIEKKFNKFGLVVTEQLEHFKKYCDESVDKEEQWPLAHYYFTINVIDYLERIEREIFVESLKNKGIKIRGENDGS